MPRSRSPIKARLQEWHLRRIPFPATPFVDPFNVDPLRNGSVFARSLREAEIVKIRHDILKEGYAGAVKPWSWVWARKRIGGSLGMGKTALLAYVTDQINRDYGKTFFGRAAHWVAVYVPVLPSIKSVQEVASIALVSVCSQARGPSVERHLLGRLRRKAILLSTSSEYPELVKRAADSKFLDDRWLIGQGVDLSRLNAAVEKHLREQRVTSAFAHALAEGGLEQYLITINGDPTLVPPKPALAHRALSLLLNDLARAVSAAEINQLTFFLDDFYYLVRKTAERDRTALAADLRALAVTGGAGFAAVRENIFSWVAVMHTRTASGFNAAWEAVDLHRVAPLKLDAESSVVLNQIPVGRGRELLSAYLAYQRPSRAPSDTYPFAPEALDAITHITAEQEERAADMVEPRSLLQSAFEVTSQALLLGSVQVPIGPDFVAHVLKGAPLPVMPADDEANEPDSERELGLSLACPCDCHSDDAPQRFYDVRERVGGATGAVVGHYCAACSMPVSIIVDVHA